MDEEIRDRGVRRLYGLESREHAEMTGLRGEMWRRVAQTVPGDRASLFRRYGDKDAEGRRAYPGSAGFRTRMAAE